MNDQETVADVFEDEWVETEAEYKEIADIIGLEGKEVDRYARFMTQAFENKQNWTYAKEWAERFDRPEGPEYAMDEVRKATYEEVKEAI